jgi:hypothetical protein
MVASCLDRSVLDGSCGLWGGLVSLSGIMKLYSVVLLAYFTERIHVSKYTLKST